MKMNFIQCVCCIGSRGLRWIYSVQFSVIWLDGEDRYRVWVLTDCILVFQGLQTKWVKLRGCYIHIWFMAPRFQSYSHWERNESGVTACRGLQMCLNVHFSRKIITWLQRGIVITTHTNVHAHTNIKYNHILWTLSHFFRHWIFISAKWPRFPFLAKLPVCIWSLRCRNVREVDIDAAMGRKKEKLKKTPQTITVVSIFSPRVLTSRSGSIMKHFSGFAGFCGFVIKSSPELWNGVHPQQFLHFIKRCPSLAQCLVYTNTKSTIQTNIVITLTFHLYVDMKQHLECLAQRACVSEWPPSYMFM